ncbi:hypothetical protein ASG87_01370 [Frateuria sp. Soil773]|uniref:type 4 pilus major pilin n=1 Tax=Frateuria sp. Soil773 TaxID=1736407 RepID=UPI0006F40FF3|nr:type 4 pilus major pilin [Frateuria sp. Soil773]KRE90813.1 hypothetical protein ASG87_01370 [Frateuria sp. Soil773]
MNAQSHRTHTRGFGLFETILTFAILIAASATVWALAAPAGVTTQVAAETTRLSTLVQNIDGAFANAGDFAGVTTANGIRDGWQAPGISPVDTAWGTFDLAPATVHAPNDAWSASYSTVPPEACAQLTAQALHSMAWLAVTVDGTSVSTTTAQSACTDPQHPTHALVLVRYVGTKTGPTSGLQPLCFDRYRKDPRGYETGCPQNDSAYAPAPHTL